MGFRKVRLDENLSQMNLFLTILHRDGAIPGSRRLAFDKINEKFGVPLNAMILITIVQLVLGLIYLGSSAAFNAFNGSGVIFLTLSYVIPVAISFFTGRKSLSAGKYDLGLFGAFCNVVSIGRSIRLPKLTLN